MGIKSTARCTRLDKLTFGCPFFCDSAAQEEGGQQGEHTACACACACISVALDFFEPMLNLSDLALAGFSLL